MDLRESPGAILEMLAKNEEIVGRLYTAYANKFPKMREFWAALADDEKTHAMWIRILKDMVLEGKFSFKTDRFRIAPIITFSQHIENEINKTTVPGFNLNNALLNAISIEENLIESKYFEALETDSKDLQRILNDLHMATMEHAQILRDTRDVQRPKNNIQNSLDS